MHEYSTRDRAGIEKCTAGSQRGTCDLGLGTRGIRGRLQVINFSGSLGRLGSLGSLEPRNLRRTFAFYGNNIVDGPNLSYTPLCGWRVFQYFYGIRIYSSCLNRMSFAVWRFHQNISRIARPIQDCDSLFVRKLVLTVRTLHF
jgi:hypothetical protein